MLYKKGNRDVSIFFTSPYLIVRAISRRNALVFSDIGRSTIPTTLIS